MTTKATLTQTKFAADFWCGGGGTSEGLMQAAEELGMEIYLTAVNHWDIAVATHSANHAHARHYCKAVDSLSPLDLFPDRVLDILIASPECTHHSNARGGKPRDEQKRADANDIKRWVEKLYVKKMFLENVKEFMDWGPLDRDGNVIEKKKGVYFWHFIKFLRETHHVEWKILNCANYGDATTRERFFLKAVHKDLRRRPVWAIPSHTKRESIENLDTQPSFFNNPKTMQPWKPAKEIIDWSLKGESIFLTPEDVKERKLKIKRPLSDNTMKRIIAGLFKYSLKPFLLNNKGKDRRDGSIDNPTFTQCAGGNHQFLIELESYLIQHFGERKGQKERTKSIDETLWTVTGQGRMSIATPFVASLANTGKESRESKDKRIYEIERPLVTITGKNFLALLEPYIIKYFTGSDAASINEPLPTVTANYEHLGLINLESFLTKYHGAETEAMDINDPLSTLTTKDRLATAEPYLLRMKANQDAQSIDEPLKALTTRNSYALVIPQLGIALDILFRMLQPHELAAAMSFPKSYSFAGNRAEQVKQIGNAVPVKTAKAELKALLEI
jgi:DNA (cytosine-5)-methyltransferase 1